MFYQFNQTVGFQFFKEHVVLVPAFAKVMRSPEHGELAMKWLLAIHDIRSPYYSKYHLKEERIIAVNEDYFNKRNIDWEHDPIMVNAANALEEHFYDSDFVQYQVFDYQIRQEVEKMRGSADTAEIRKIGQVLKELEDLRKGVMDNLTYKLKTGLFDEMVFKKGQVPSMLTKVMEEEKQRLKEKV